MSPITQDQIDILDSLVVERLSDNVDNVALVRTFNNVQNKTLTRIIKKESTLYKDASGVTAYYVVKTLNGDLLLYFSLKCGELFENLDLHKMELAVQTQNALKIVIQEEDPKSKEYSEAQQFIKENIEEIKSILPTIDDFLQKKGQYNLELEKEINSKIQRVLHTYPAIELVEFCSNDNTRAVWKSIGLPEYRKLGECIFWYYIVPKLQTAQEIIGCQYVYLFAADSSYDENLINYYKSKLKFEQPLTLGANKPQYDFQCTFLCQKLNTLIKEKEKFFKEFNSEEDYV